jgi:hypothetical protein
VPWRTAMGAPAAPPSRGCLREDPTVVDEDGCEERPSEKKRDGGLAEKRGTGGFLMGERRG